MRRILSCWVIFLASACASPSSRDQPVTSLPQWAALRLLDGYRAAVSPVGGRRCNYTPSCSRYATAAIQRYGPLKGWVMTHDRLMRCTQCLTISDYRIEDGKLVDPPEHSDWWGSTSNVQTGPVGGGGALSAGPRVRLLAAGSDKAASFADTLYSEGWYARAWTEYRRYLFDHPDADTPAIRLRMARCLLASGEDRTARAALEDLVDRGPDAPEAYEAVYLLGRDHQSQNLWPAAAAEFGWILERASGGPQPHPGAGLWAGPSAYALGWGLLARGEWATAAEALARVPQDSPLHAPSQRLANLAPQGAELPARSPGLAMALSAVLPGAGHVYAGRPGDGITAFLLNTAVGLAAYQAFRADQDALGAGMAFFELGWYAGNLYTAAGAAHRYNQAQRRGFLESLEAEAPPPEPIPGLEWRWEF